MRRRPRALALSLTQQEERGRRLARLLPWMVLAAGLTFAAGAGWAQATPGSGAGGSSRAATAAQEKAQGAILSKDHTPVVKEGGSVLKPVHNPDPGMALATPNPQKFPTPVIKPPVTPGSTASGSTSSGSTSSGSAGTGTTK